MNEQSTNNQFTLYIPTEISSDSNLNLSEMRVLATIKALDKDKKCFATNSYMAECLGISTRHVSRVISSLEKKGYILVENKNSFKRTIKVQAKSQEVSMEQVQERKVAPKEETTSKQQTSSVPTKHRTTPTKVERFNQMDSHDWDFKEIEALERKFIEEKLKNMTLSERGKELINKSNEYSEEPTEWTGISQLAFKEGATCKPKELAYQ